MAANFRTDGFAMLMRRAHGGRNPFDIVQDLARELYWRLGRTRPPFLATDYARILSLPVTFRDIPAEGLQTDGASLSMIAARREGALTASVEGILRIDANVGPLVVLQRPQAGEAICSKHRRNFTLAHEIGHFVMRRAVEGFVRLDKLTPHDPEEELLANHFASEILMPADRLTKSLAESDINLSAFIMLSQEYEVSAQAFFVRVRKLLPGELVFLMHRRGSHGPELLWSTPSTFKRVILGESARSMIDHMLHQEGPQQAVSSPGPLEFLLNGKPQRWSFEACGVGRDPVVFSWLKKGFRRDRFCVPTKYGRRPSRPQPAQLSFSFLG